MSYFNKNVDDVLRILTKTLKDLQTVEAKEATRADELSTAAEIAKAESIRATRVRTKLQELIS